MRTRSSKTFGSNILEENAAVVAVEKSNTSIIESDDNDAPVATSFKQQAVQRVKAEKAAKASANLAKQNEKAKRKAKAAHSLIENQTKHAKNDMEEALDLPDIRNADKEDGEGASNQRESELSDDGVSRASSRRKGAKHSSKNRRPHDSEDEFRMADTFDFRQYLPKDILEEVNEDDESDDDILGEVSSDEEEMANALMVGNGGDSGDDSDDDDSGKTPKRAKIPKQGGKKTNDKESAGTPKNSKSSKGRRHYRKKYSATPRVIILSRQDTTAKIRERADAYVNERLFGIPSAATRRGGGAPKRSAAGPRGPRRMTQEGMQAMADKLRVRRMGLKNMSSR